jgi:predicted RNA-binding Zn-ribbon protein involved in translation (DUF1610 family)
MNPKNPRIQHLSQYMPDMPCPNCGNLIPTSIQQILFSNSLCCPICGLKINIDKRKSDKALEMLKKIDDAQKKSEELLQVSNKLKY